MQHPHQVGQIQMAMAKTLERVGSRAIICADWRNIDVFAPEIAERVIAMLTVTNPRLACSAILLEPRNATFNLQVERVIRDAASPVRKSFRDQEKLLAWFAGFSEPAELESAREFLSLGVPSA
jgi:hypothetical protein